MLAITMLRCLSGRISNVLFGLGCLMAIRPRMMARRTLLVCRRCSGVGAKEFRDFGGVIGCWASGKEGGALV